MYFSIAVRDFLFTLTADKTVDTSPGSTSVPLISLQLLLQEQQNAE